MHDATLARRALALLDLTDLSDGCSDLAIDRLVAKAVAAPPGPVAAICIWPQFVTQARNALRKAPVEIATVANFPSGEEDIERVCATIEEALADGAHEIDLVMPYRSLLAGDRARVREVLTAVRDIVPARRILKVILETGALGTRERIGEAARIAIGEGADFIKTSTGKIAVSATPDAAEEMFAAIRAAGRPVGFKAAGGLRTLAEARTYLDIAARVMGEEFATPATFRFGASGLYDVLAQAAAGSREERASDGTY